ncbi:MAG: alcohol dehydrogenase-like regulatory protein ErcA [Armatimonadota bacterium]|nr:iron-containing alcohol dehydrogenase [bacterium]
MNPAMELELRKFVAPEFVFGSGARHLVAQYAANFGARKVLVVTDPGVIKAGWTKDVTDTLESAEISHIVFSDVTSNPRAEEVMAGAEVYRQERCNAIVAVGGGSPIDCAKGIGIVVTNEKHILDFEGVDEVPIPAPPLICIPTTSGSAAEVSQFAIITDLARRVKIAIISKTIVPDAALIDPVTLTTMPSDLTAYTGLDVLVHALEAFVSNAQSPITSMFALEACRLVPHYLAATIREPENMIPRGKMMRASLSAGLAFSNAGLGLAHAMAHSLGGLLDKPHGESNAILMPYVVSYNFAEAADEYTEIADAMGLDVAKKSSEDVKIILVNALKELVQSVGVAPKLSDIGVKHSDIPELARHAMDDLDIATNPRAPSQRDVEVVYEQAL